jgi:hypothetical protein
MLKKLALRFLEAVKRIRIRLYYLLDIAELKSLASFYKDMNLHSVVQDRQLHHKNTFVRYGRKSFSQSDEDGLTLEVIRRLGIDNGTFVEFGVGNGTENNTLLLAALGWNGFWVGGQNLAFSVDESKRLDFYKRWVTKENILEIFREGCLRLERKPDVISLDLDGNDLYLYEELLSNGIRPSFFIAEYNARFIPPIKFSVEYDANHRWVNDDYFGASLTSLNELFLKYDYTLICCNAATGANAFFVRNEFVGLFPEVPGNINDIYSAPFYHLFDSYGHKASIKTILSVIKN